MCNFNYKFDILNRSRSISYAKFDHQTLPLPKFKFVIAKLVLKFVSEKDKKSLYSRMKVWICTEM